MARYRIAVFTGCERKEVEAISNIAEILDIPRSRLDVDSTHRNAGTVDIRINDLSDDAVKRIRGLETVQCVRRMP